MSEHTIDVIKAFGAVHDAYGKARTLPENSTERERLAAYANSALSATLVYARERNPPVQKKHYDAVEALYTEMGVGTPKEREDVDAA